MPLTVRRAAPTDQAALAALLSDMQAHYQSADPPGGAFDMARLLTRDGERIPFALLAEHDGKAVGLATLSPVLFGGAYQWILWLKDLYVTDAARSLGAGSALMAEIARIALAGDYARVNFTTDAANEGAQRLYERLGVPTEAKVYYKLAGDALQKVAAL